MSKKGNMYKENAWRDKTGRRKRLSAIRKHFEPLVVIPAGKTNLETICTVSNIEKKYQLGLHGAMNVFAFLHGSPVDPDTEYPEWQGNRYPIVTLQRFKDGKILAEQIHKEEKR